MKRFAELCNALESSAIYRMAILLKNGVAWKKTVVTLSATFFVSCSKSFFRSSALE
jgi:hypothetical protein